MRVRLAQLFDVNGQYVPTKASLYLKRVGENPGSSFDLGNGSVTFDATNCQSIDGDYTVKAFFDHSTDGYTGNGYMQTVSTGTGTVGIATVNYPVSTPTPGKYYVHVRGQNVSSFAFAILIDGVEVGSYQAGDPESPSWQWGTVPIVLPDVNIHQLGIQIKETGAKIDKVWISQSSTNPTSASVGPDFDRSPFITLHLQVYETANEEPTNPLNIYAYKTTLDEVITDDWYNFETRLFTGTYDFTASYALVLSATGGYEGNYVIWEMVNNDEYLILPSAIKVDNA